MRILFAIHTWPPDGRGGTEVHASEVGRALMGRGHQVGVFARRGDPSLPAYKVTTEVRSDIGITRVNNLFRDNHTLEWIYRNRWVHEAFEREVEEFKPDLVHVHHLTGLSSTIIEAAKLRGLPVVFSLHDFWTFCPRGQRMTTDLDLCEDVDRERCYGCLAGLWPHLFADREKERTVVDLRGRLSPESLAEWDRHMTYVLNLCDVLVCPSEFHRERILDYPIDPDRIRTLPHGIDTTGFRPEARRPRERPRTIGFIGAAIPVKGVHVLLEAFRRLGRPDLTLEIHGEVSSFHDDATYPERLRALAAGLDNVVFHGPYDHEDVPHILEDIDVLVVPSLWWETFCLTIREGLAAGVPVVASDLGAMREALDGEENGLLFRPGDPADLARRLAELIDRPELYARYVGRGGAVKTLETYVVELEELYGHAVAVSERRHGTLVVAPPAFPEEPPRALPAAPREAEVVSRPPGTAPWERVGVEMRQEGPLAANFTTRMPTDEDPALGVDIAVDDGSGRVGRLGIVVDLRAVLAARGPGGTDVPQGDGAAPDGRPRRKEQHPVAGRGRVRRARLSRPRKLRRLAVRRPGGRPVRMELRKERS